MWGWGEQVAQTCIICRSAAFIPRNLRKAADSLQCESLRYPARLRCAMSR